MWHVGVALLVGFACMLIISDSHSHGNDEQSDLTSGTLSAFWGLLSHAAVDGVVLGVAAAAVSEEEGEAWSGTAFVIFAAIMMHKIPAAFGLGAMLRRDYLAAETRRSHSIASRPLIRGRATPSSVEGPSAISSAPSLDPVHAELQSSGEGVSSRGCWRRMCSIRLPSVALKPLVLFSLAAPLAAIVSYYITLAISESTTELN